VSASNVCVSLFNSYFDSQYLSPRAIALETVLPVYGPLVSSVPDGDNSNRTNPAHRESAP
jgi:hypothetical protein